MKHGMWKNDWKSSMNITSYVTVYIAMNIDFESLAKTVLLSRAFIHTPDHIWMRVGLEQKVYFPPCKLVEGRQHSFGGGG